MIACCVNLIVFQLTLLAVDHLYPSVPGGSKKIKIKNVSIFRNTDNCVVQTRV